MYRNFIPKAFSVSILLFVTGSSWGYEGYLFDAMTQIDERVDMYQAMRKVKQSGVDKIALFARSRKYLRENEDDLLSLRDEYSNLIALGAPKYFLMRGDLDDDYIEATINGISRSNYLFVGEILYTHGDKSHGEQTDRGERYIDPLNKGTEELLSRLEKLNVPVMTHWKYTHGIAIGLVLVRFIRATLK